ncbi:TetR/AcrR family transcriptional regulator [Pseudomonas putida]
MNTTEKRIRDAAIKLIARVGYPSMSLRLLATESGINSSTLYLYYKGKQELLTTLVLHHYEQLAAGWNRQCPDTSARNKLKAFVAFHLATHLNNKDEAVLGNMELRCLEEHELLKVRQARRRYLGSLQQILDQGVGEGTWWCDESKLLSRIIIGLLTQACAWYRNEGQMGIEEVIARYTQIVLNMLEGPGPRLQVCA